MLLGAAACDSPAPSSDDDNDRLRVAVSIQPQVFFAKQIGGDRVLVHSLLSPGQSHGAFDPSPKQVAEIARARAFFRIGVAFEGPLIERLRDVAPGLEVVDTREGIELLHIEGHEHHHDEHTDHVCGDGELDPHVWLDPILVQSQARTMAASLSRLDPGHAAEYERNLARFLAELDRIDAQVRDVLAPHRGRAFLVFHPSFAYYCRRYGLEQVVIETGGKEPSPRRLAELIQQARTVGTKTVFAQEEYSAGSAQAVAEAIGGQVVRLAPMSSDWQNNLLQMTQAIAAALAASPPTTNGANNNG